MKVIYCRNLPETQQINHILIEFHLWLTFRLSHYHFHVLNALPQLQHDQNRVAKSRHEPKFKYGKFYHSLRVPLNSDKSLQSGYDNILFLLPPDDP